MQRESHCARLPTSYSHSFRRLKNGTGSRIFRWNHQRPNRSQQMLSADGKHVWYWSAQVTRAPCLCRSFFGADAHQKHVPTSSDLWKSGSEFKTVWEANLLKNYALFQNQDLRPVWLDKSWQALWNWNDHNQNHGIDPHSDECLTYSSLDPITSFSFGRGGVLTLGAKKEKSQTNMLFQEDGDALIMAGEFQAEFCHGVPPRSSWSQLQLLPMYTEMQDWEKHGFDLEVASHEAAQPGDKHVRVNCTVRWHTTHWSDVRCIMIKGPKMSMGLSRLLLGLSGCLRTVGCGGRVHECACCWSRVAKCPRHPTGCYWGCLGV